MLTIILSPLPSHTSYSPSAFASREDFMTNKDKGLDQVKLKRDIEASQKEFSENHAAFRTKISDYNTLAFSMRRAGNVQAEVSKLKN